MTKILLMKYFKARYSYINIHVISDDNYIQLNFTHLYFPVENIQLKGLGMIFADLENLQIIFKSKKIYKWIKINNKILIKLLKCEEKRFFWQVLFLRAL